MPSLRSDQAPAEEPASDGEDLCFTPATILAAAIRQKEPAAGELLLILFANNITVLVFYIFIPTRRSFYTPYSDQQRMVGDS